MELTAYLGTVAGLVTMAVALVHVVVGQLGRRIDEMSTGLNTRIDEMSTGLNTRIDDLTGRVAHVEIQNDAIIGAVGDLGQRVAHLERRGA